MGIGKSGRIARNIPTEVRSLESKAFVLRFGEAVSPRNIYTLSNNPLIGEIFPMSSKPEVLLFTDGACSGNPGPGGWAFILQHPKSGKELVGSGGQKQTTNNQMEMIAVIEGLSALKKSSCVELFSDSTYVLKGISEWMPGWKKNKWRRREGGSWKPLKNAELWMKLDELIVIHEMKYTHVRGHSGHPENERCDQLAVGESRKFL